MKFATIFVIFVVCLLGVKAQFSPYRTVFDKLHREPPPPVSVFRNNINLHYIRQKLDHFNAAETRTWQMRYMSNDYYFKKDAPIFIFVGGEWSISEGYLRGGHMFDMAKSMNGYMFYTEHRFYGRSQPTIDLKTENLKYLTVNQALADLAHFIETVKATIPGLENSKVIIVGGSYSATMVTWFRRIYPHLANGAWASSAPLFAKVDFTEYKEVVGKSIIAVGGQECYDRVERAVKTLEGDIKNHELGKVQQYINICSNFDTKNKNDVMSLFSTLSDIFAGLVQGHNTGDIEGACRTIYLAADDVTGLGNFIKAYVGAGNQCIELNYNAEVAELKDTAANGIMRQWYYQTCNEFGWYQTSGSEKQPFGTEFPVEHYTNMCKDVYGFDFNTPEKIEAKIQKTNDYFGGFNPDVTNVYFTQGELDPWSEMGIKRNDENAALVPLYAHCKDLASSSIRDTEEMAALKRTVTERVQQWLK